MQKIVIDNLVLSPSIEVVSRMGSQQFWISVWSPLLASIVAFILTLLGFWVREVFFIKQPQEKAIKIAIKYEIYRNFYQMIDMKKVAEEMRKEHNYTKKVIYCEPYYLAFELMMKNGLILAFRNEEDVLFSIYDIIREYDLVYKYHVDYLNSKTTADVMKLDDRLCKIIDLADIQEKKLEEYLDRVGFLSKDEWGRFRLENNNIWGNPIKAKGNK